MEIEERFTGKSLQPGEVGLSAAASVLLSALTSGGVVLIPRQTAKAEFRARAFKLVDCEECYSRYYYVIQRESTESRSGTFVSQEKLREDARNSFMKSMLHEHDLVPCPNCGHVSSDIAKSQVKSSRAFGMATKLMQASLPVGAIGVIVLFLYLVNFAYHSPTGSWAIPPAILGAALLLLGTGHGLRRLLHRVLDPNLQPIQVRKEIAQLYAITEEEFNAYAEKPFVIRSGTRGQRR